MTSPHDRTVGQAQELAERVTATVHGSLPGAPTIAAVLLEPAGRVQMTAVKLDGEGRPTSESAEMALYVGGEVVAYWRMSLLLGLDHSGRYLKTMKSSMALRSVWEGAPLVRLEYDGANTTAPMAHWHFHGERGAFSHLLARASAGSRYVTDKPHSLSKLHFPVGGERFRPCLEDFVEFLIRECGVDCRERWQEPLREGRELWRRMQARALTRDLQVEAAEQLRIQGWTVTPPEDYDDHEHGTTLTGW